MPWARCFLPFQGVAIRNVHNCLVTGNGEMGEGRWKGVLADDISPSQWPPLLIRPYCQIITPLSIIFFFPNTEKKGRGKVGGGGKIR